MGPNTSAPTQTQPFHRPMPVSLAAATAGLCGLPQTAGAGPAPRCGSAHLSGTNASVRSHCHPCFLSASGTPRLTALPSPCLGGVPSLLAPSPGLSCPWPYQKGGLCWGALDPRALSGWQPPAPWEARPWQTCQPVPSSHGGSLGSQHPASLCPRPGSRPPCPLALVLRRHDVTRRRGEGAD